MKSRNPKSTESLKGKPAGPVTDKFPVVGIGASAGGLEAFEQFFKNVPEKSGMAYVVIQHLDPTHKGLLPELLQRITSMLVFQVKDRMALKPNCVYVIPPNKSMSVLKGKFHLFDAIETKGLRLPIDFFLRSLAEDFQEQGIGVILSGMGSDGSMGVRAIKERNGIVMVQDPATAKYNSMPRSAIDSVIVDIVAPAHELPEKLMYFLNHIPVVRSDMEVEMKDKSALSTIIILLRIHTGNDFSLYKKNTVYRRIERRMGVHKIDKIASYVRFLQENPKEVDILFKELLIGVTSFFRDSFLWESMSESVFRSSIDDHEEGSVIRAWVPGCSTGEEAFSLAIVFKETLEKINPHGGITLQIFATDLDNEAIETARKGIFPRNIANDVSTKRLNRFFIPTDEGYRINTEIREMVVFAHHNLIMHPPFTKIDILSCRNLLIYLEPELQKKIFGLFYYSINPEGIMILGSAESLGTQSHLFTPVDTKLKIYRRSPTNPNPESFDFPTSFSRTKPPHTELQIPTGTGLNIQTLADQILLQQFSPPGVLVNENGDIIYISGRTGKYLEPAVGKANLNIFAMLREGLRNELPEAFQKVVKNKNAVILNQLKVGTNGGTQTTNVSIQWIGKPGLLRGKVMIVFNVLPDVADITARSNIRTKNLKPIHQSELEEELQQAREEKQSIFEEMQTSQEELKSTNEELQSTNEELQSTNEELMSSKEEMQSLNEELQTVNAELQSKVDEFSRVDNDMKNLLNSTDIATLFLDKELNIRRYTDQATKIFKLIKSDIGRPLTDQVSELIYPEMTADALEVLRKLVFLEKQIPTIDNRWFLIRIMPYRTIDDRIDGLVITFINITDHIRLQTGVKETEYINQLLLQSSSDVIIKLSSDWKISEFNPAAEKLFEIKRKDAVNMNFIELFIPEPEQKKTRKNLEKMLNEVQYRQLKMRIIAAGGIVKVVEWKGNVLQNSHEMPTGVILTTTK